MTQRHKVVFERLPNITIRSGGSRRLDMMSMRRPWQGERTLAEGPCPLCAATDEILARSGSWRLIPTLRANYVGARLLVSRECAHDLKGATNIWTSELKSALLFARDLVRDRDTMFGVQVGGLAGGSVLHPHAHLMELDTDGKSRATRKKFLAGRKLPLIERFDGVVAVAGGTSAGQALLFPCEEEDISSHGERLVSLVPSHKPSFPDSVAFGSAIVKLLGKYLHKFEAEGRAPEYQIGVVFSKKKIVYATIVPILSQPGIGDNLALFEGRAKPVGWTHKETARFLREP